jgi:hypothetical protein
MHKKSSVLSAPRNRSDADIKNKIAEPHRKEGQAIFRNLTGGV